MRWAAICTVALLSGCSLGGDEEPAPATGTARQIGALVRQLDLAVQRRDAGAVCDDLLTAAARARSGGSRCRRRVGRALAGLRDPRLELRRIDSNGARAVVRLRTEAAGVRPGDQVVDLRRVDGQWRLEALRR
jgi:hypothetical protein